MYGKVPASFVLAKSKKHEDPVCFGLGLVQNHVVLS